MIFWWSKRQIGIRLKMVLLAYYFGANGFQQKDYSKTFKKLSNE